MAANYRVLDPGLYQIKRAEVLFALVDETEGAVEKWYQFGDVDSFTLNITPTKIERFRKNAAVRTKAAEVTNQVDSAVSFTCYQWIPFVRALSVMGKQEYLVQEAAVAQTKAFKATVGASCWLGHFDVTGVGVTGSGDTPPEWVAGQHFVVTDAALGMAQIIALPDGVAADSDITFGFGASAVVEGDKRLKARVASETDIAVKIMVRGVGRNQVKDVLMLNRVTLSPSGDVSLIGEDDFTPIEITGSALDTSEGVGVLVDLKD